MKIFHFASYTNDSRYFQDLGRGLAEKKLDVSYGTLFETGRIRPKWIGDATPYVCLNIKSKVSFASAIWRLARILRREKVDILQTHLYEASFVGFLAAKLAGTPLKILTRHHLDQNHQIGNKLSLALDRWEARTADEIIGLSNAVKEFMISAEEAEADKITVIHQGFDFDMFAATDDDGNRVRQEFGLTDKDFVVATIGNFTSTKGHRFIISAAARLQREIPNLKLMFIGDGGDKGAVEAQIAEANLQSRVIFTGFRRDVGACIKSANVVVHPSLSEAFCQVLVETMSVGTPLISTDVGGAKEVITHGETGILIRPGDVDAIVDAMLRLYQNADLTKKMTLAGQQSVRATFTVEKMIDRQIAVYERLFSRK